MKTETSFVRNAKKMIRDDKQVRVLIALIVIIFVVLAAWGIYNYSSTRKLRAAHRVFVEGLEEFEKNMAAKSDQQKWDDVARTFDMAYKLYGTTAFAPTFLAYKSRALVNENKLDEAIKAMQSTVGLLKKSSPFFYVYSAKCALMKIDSSDQKVQAEGKKELEILANDSKNLQRDYALYYAGLNAFNHGDSKNARILWSKIAQVNSESVWLPLVLKKQELLGS